MGKRDYTIRRAAGSHLTAEMRETLGRRWNACVSRCRRITLREFARENNIPYETWRREYHRGAACFTLRRGNRWEYAEYDLSKAEESINTGKGNMGAKMKMTMSMAMLFRHCVKDEGRSPYDARLYVKENLPDADVPCLKTFYNHIEAGDMGVTRDDTPNPRRLRRRRRPPHAAKVVPGRRILADRPKAAQDRSELGHYEMDTVVSGIGGRGGLLVMLDRMSRRYVIEHVNHIAQDDVIAAIRRMKSRGALRDVRSVTTDNGCEFLDQTRLDKVFKAETYYTRAYASYEKGSIENCNRLVRRWYPKGTNFDNLTRRQIQRLEDMINSIHRKSLNGETANAYDSRMAEIH